MKNLKEGTDDAMDKDGKENAGSSTRTWLLTMMARLVPEDGFFALAATFYAREYTFDL